MSPAQRTRAAPARERRRIVLLEGVHPAAIELLRADGGLDVEVHDKALPEARLKATLKDAQLIGIRSRTQLTAAVLEHAGQLLAIGCFCIGTNQVDVASAEKLGIPVFNAPFSNTRSVAEMVLAEIVMLLRGIPARNAAAHRGEWLKSAAGAHEARGKVLGIVGYGHIGTQIGLLAESLGMKVVFYDIVSKLALGNAGAVRSLNQLLERADIVTLHVPETPATRMMIAARELARMKRGAALINASRGSVVDINALAAALDSGQLSGAAIDVFPEEPESNHQPFVSPLTRFDNVILTPHIGGSTAEAQQSIGIEVAEKLLRYVNNGSTLSAVNFPEVMLPEHVGKHRLLHIHRNQPGMLTRVNAVFSRHGVNVAAEYLQTSTAIGYAVIDVDPEGVRTAELRRELDDIPGTIRTRTLY